MTELQPATGRGTTSAIKASLFKLRVPLIIGVILILAVLLYNTLLSHAFATPNDQAEVWYRAYHGFDSQTVGEITCAAQVGSVLAELTNSETQVNSYKSYDFDLSGVKYQTISQSDDSAIVDVTGDQRIILDGITHTARIQKRWAFVREAGVWKWCGELPYQSGSLSLLSPAVYFGIVILIVLVIVLWPRRRRFDEVAYDRARAALLERSGRFESGWIQTWNRSRGAGLIRNDAGDTFFMDPASFVTEGYGPPVAGEKVSFQPEWTSSGPRATHVIRLDQEATGPSTPSRQLHKLVAQVSDLRAHFHTYRAFEAYQKMNQCRAFFELYNTRVKAGTIRLQDFEVVLLGQVDMDLKFLAEQIENFTEEVSWWGKVLKIILRLLDIVAELIAVPLPHVASVLRTLSNLGKRLLGGGPKPPDLLGPGDR